MNGYTIKRVGLREIAMKEDTPVFTRKIGTQKWEPYKPSGQPDGSRALLLCLVRQAQPDGQGHHWSLFVAEEGQRGTVYQVVGDHTYMVHGHRQNVNILGSSSFRDTHQLAELDMQKSQRVAHWADREQPPPVPQLKPKSGRPVSRGP